MEITETAEWQDSKLPECENRKVRELWKTKRAAFQPPKMQITKKRRNGYLYNIFEWFSSWLHHLLPRVRGGLRLRELIHNAAKLRT